MSTHFFCREKNEGTFVRGHFFMGCSILLKVLGLLNWKCLRESHVGWMYSMYKGVAGCGAILRRVECVVGFTRLLLGKGGEEKRGGKVAQGDKCLSPASVLLLYYSEYMTVQ